MNFNQESYEDQKTFQRLVKTCRDATDYSWNLGIINDDIICRNLSNQLKEEIINYSEECGIWWANQIRHTYGNVPLYEIIKKCGLKVCFQNYGKPSKNQPIYFAQYSDNTIYISRDIIKEIERLSAIYDLEDVLGEADVGELLCAHEFFHYLEDIHKKDMITTNLKVKGCGAFGRKGVPYPASEIGAFSFAKQICGITFHPRVIEIVALYYKIPNKVTKIINNLNYD